MRKRSGVLTLILVAMLIIFMIGCAKAPKLISSRPADDSQIAPDGTLALTFDSEPTNVTVNGQPALVSGRTATWKPAEALSPGKTTFNVTWDGGSGTIAANVMSDLVFPFFEEDKKEEGVVVGVVVVPWQGKQVEVKRLDLEIPKMMEDQDKFLPGTTLSINRLVVNFDVFDGDTKLTAFDPPIQLYVAYINEDLQDENGCRRVILAYWNGERWTRLTAKKNHFELRPKEAWPFGEQFELPEEALGFGFASIPDWDDGDIGWGGLD